MGERTAIQWTHHTFNPWIGCTKVSAGCTHCYAEARDRRWNGGHWGKGAPRQRTTEANWRQPLKWNRDAEKEGVRRRVFCASLADVFDAEVDPSWRFDLLVLIGRTPHLDWQLLTKRPENIAKLWPTLLPGPSHYENVWIGTSVEDQAAADLRIPALLQVPAGVRFLSCEPLLGPLEFNRCAAWNPMDHGKFLEGISWVIVGGESGPGARPMHAEWAQDVLKQCRETGVACFMKQLGHVAAGWYGLADKKGGDWSEWPADLRVREFPGVEP